MLIKKNIYIFSFLIFHADVWLSQAKNVQEPGRLLHLSGQVLQLPFHWQQALWEGLQELFWVKVTCEHMGFLCQSLYIPYKLWMFCRLSETRSGEICNACVLLVKRWKKLPVGTKKNWNHVSLDLITDGTERWLDQANSFSFEIPSSKVVDARGGPSLKITSRPKKIKSISKRARPSQISRLQKELKRHSGFLCDFELKMSSLKKKKKNCVPNNSSIISLLPLQILMLTAPPPVPLQLSLQATATCQTTVQTLSSVQVPAAPPFSLFWI